MPNSSIIDPSATTNEQRAANARVALQAFKDCTGSDDCDAIADLITNLAHYCDRHGVNLGNEIRRACGHYREENPTGKQFNTVLL